MTQTQAARPTLSLPPRFWVEPVRLTGDAVEDAFSFEEAFELMRALHREGGYARLNVVKSRRVFHDVLKEGMTFLARLEAPYRYAGADREEREDPAGMPIGVLAMTEGPWWYSDEEDTHFVDLGFFVLPRYRRGRVGVELLKAVRVEAQARGRIAFIVVTSPDRQPKRTRMATEALTAGFVPLGHTLRLN